MHKTMLVLRIWFDLSNYNSKTSQHLKITVRSVVLTVQQYLKVKKSSNTRAHSVSGTEDSRLAGPCSASLLTNELQCLSEAGADKPSDEQQGPVRGRHKKQEGY